MVAQLIIVGMRTTLIREKIIKKTKKMTSDFTEKSSFFIPLWFCSKLVVLMHDTVKN